VPIGRSTVREGFGTVAVKGESNGRGKKEGAAEVTRSQRFRNAVRYVTAIAVAAACSSVLAQGSSSTTYKWVDDKGVVHYTDKIPPEAINKGSVQLDKQGVTVRRIDPALTPEQRRVKADEEARAQQLAKERELVDRRDRALLSTYTMESEIDLARRRALSTIEQQIQSATAQQAQGGARSPQDRAEWAGCADGARPRAHQP
jgi:hypothetical protein